MIGAATGLIGGLLNYGAKRKLAKKQQRLADEINPVDSTYNISEYSKRNLGMYQQERFGRMKGAASAERNIMANQAGALAGIERNSTDSSQSLAMLAGLQGQTDQSFMGLADRENANNQNAMAGLSGAYATMNEEQRRVYEDQVRKFNNDTAAKAALQNASWANKMSATNDLASGIALAGQAASQLDFSGKKKSLTKKV